MPDEIDPPEKPEFSAQDESSAPGQPSSPFRSPLVVGQRWHEYQVGDQIDSDSGWCYHAVNVGMLEDVELRVFQINEQAVARAQAWRELQSVDMPGLHKGIEALEESGFRFEIARVLPKTTLREWASCRQASVDDVQVLVQQLSDVLIAVHDRGLVHLNLRPEIIYILSEEAGLRVMIGGLEHVTVYNQAGLIPVPVDPFYAPPEASGLAKHSPGATLRAWDWWALGRIIQGLILGRHVLSIVFNRDVTRPTPDLRTRAEAHLLERDPQAPRAGAVELMPPMNQRLTELLRGLLTSSRSGRWGTDEVIRWLRQQPVKDRYRLGRNEELFAWKDRVFTIDEAAEFFSRKENWADGETNLFDGDDAMTLVSFVGERPEYRPVRERIDALQKFMQIPAWKDLSVKVRKAAVASAGWLLLGGEDARLVLHGQRLDAVCIKGLLSGEGDGDGVAMVKALTALPFIQMVEQADPDAARLLSTLAAMVSGEAFAKAVMDGWVDLENAADYARLCLLAMDPERKLLDICTGLKERYACSREKHIEQLLKQTKRTRAELALVAFTAAFPERFGYVTHEDWNRERFAVLEKRGATLAAGLFWLRLGQIQKAGYVVYGPWKIVLGIWLGVAVVAGWPSGVARMWLWVPGVLAVAVAVRFLGGQWLTLLIRRKTPGALPWTFFPKADRCGQEAGVVLAGEGLALKVAVISNEFNAVQAEIAGLKLMIVPTPLPRPSLLLPAWFGTLAAWAALVSLLIAGHRNYYNTARVLPPDSEAAAAMAIEKAMTAAPADEKLTQEENFYGDAKKPVQRWDVVKPSSAPAVPLANVKPAGSDEVAAALIDGQRLLLPYKQNSINAIIAVPVGGKTGSGLILYDGRNRRVIGRQVLLPTQLPAEKTWFEVDKLKVFYVGAPEAPPLPPPNPVVDPQKPVDTSDLPEREVRRGAYQNLPPGAEQKPTNAQSLSDALDTMSP